MSYSGRTSPGKHREDNVGDLSYSDDDCLASEQIGKSIAKQINRRSVLRHYTTLPNHAKPDWPRGRRA